MRAKLEAFGIDTSAIDETLKYPKLFSKELEQSVNKYEHTFFRELVDQ
jgi:adenine-specific DNA methylase